MATGATVAAGHLTPDLLSPQAQVRQVTPLASGGVIQSSSPAPRTAHPALLKTQPSHSAPAVAAMDDTMDVADVQSLLKAVAIDKEMSRGRKSLRAALADVAGATDVAESATGATMPLFGGHRFIRPTTGRYTSGFGGRWGTFHYGIDIANRIGTPIYAVTDGTVIDSGPASGFGLWVRIRHAGGFVSVYGHINRSLVRVGQHVSAGQQIAEMGNRGQSTGPHLHFEVWNPSGRKINPLPWLAARGIPLAALAADPR